MSISPAEILACAEASSTGNEAHCRSSVSRSYYSAYHDSKAWAANSLTAVGAAGTGGMHSQFFSELTKPNIANGPAVCKNSTRRGILLRILHVKRVDADYTLTANIGPEQSKQALADAKLIITIL